MSSEATRGASQARPAVESVPSSSAELTAPASFVRGWFKVHLACLRVTMALGPKATLMWLCNATNKLRAEERAGKRRQVDEIHPGVRAIAAGCGFHERTTQRHLRLLERSGLVQLVELGGYRRSKKAGPAVKVRLKSGRATFRAREASTYSVTALGWALAHGHDLPAGWFSAIPADGRRKSQQNPPCPNPPGGILPPRVNQEEDLDLGVAVDLGVAPKPALPRSQEGGPTAPERLPKAPRAAQPAGERVAHVLSTAKATAGLGGGGYATPTAEEKRATAQALAKARAALDRAHAAKANAVPLSSRVLAGPAEREAARRWNPADAFRELGERMGAPPAGQPLPALDDAPRLHRNWMECGCDVCRRMRGGVQ